MAGCIGGAVGSSWPSGSWAGRRTPAALAAGRCRPRASEKRRGRLHPLGRVLFSSILCCQ